MVARQPCVPAPAECTHVLEAVQNKGPLSLAKYTRKKQALNINDLPEITCDALPIGHLIMSTAGDIINLRTRHKKGINSRSRLLRVTESSPFEKC